MRDIVKYAKSSFIKASIASVLFVIAFVFYNNELVREHIEDIAFDVINKFMIHTTYTDTQTPQVMIFAFDDLYMKEHHLYDEYNQSNYGYLFPRDHIADFIARLDELTSEMEASNLPKALFIDYDVSFTSLPYGKALSTEDIKLLEILKKKRPYKILLPKTSDYNFIEQSSDPDIQSAIERQDIVFVSVAFLQSKDDVIRRYNGYEMFRKNKRLKEYINVDIALWQLLHNQTIDLNASKKIFEKDDIIANRIWIKAYANGIKEDGCLTYRSYWKKLTKYSANCSLYDIIEEDYAGSVLMLGGTHTHNDDNFNVLNVLESEILTGIDMHANALMTMLYLKKGMQRVSLDKSLLIIFVSFFIVSLLVSTIFSLLKLYNNELEFIVVLCINTVVLIFISYYCIDRYHLWFNWFVPLILFELVEIFDYIKEFLSIIILKVRSRR
jgi:hypothetical protein